MCINCGTFHVFTADMLVRPPTALEQAQFQNDQNVRALAMAYANMKGARRGRMH
jgi:hypothetical protein